MKKDRRYTSDTKQELAAAIESISSEELLEYARRNSIASYDSLPIKMKLELAELDKNLLSTASQVPGLVE